jgi:Winged helix DNA-binding domain
VNERVLGLRELNRATLARQLLLERRRLPVARAVERLCALQAQYSPSPYIALWTRIAGFERHRLTRAFEQRAVVKSTLFRLTLHVVSARDFPFFAAVWLDGARTSFAGLSAETVEQLARRVHDAAKRGAVTYEELRELTPELGLRRWRVRALAPLVHEPPSGTWRFHGRVRLTAFERWLGGTLPEPEAGAAHLVRSYLAAFGPAGRDDLVRFTGLRVRDLQPGLDALEPLRRFRDESGRLLFDLPRAPLPDESTPAPARFLSRWDQLLLAHADRTRVLPAEFRDTVIRKNGDVLPTFLVDGFVAGLWELERKRDRAVLRLSPFRRLTKATRAELETEGERLLRFVEPDARSYAIDR